MNRLIKNDLKICFNSKRYQYIVLSLYVFCIFAFLRYSLGNINKSSLEIMPTYDMGMVLSISRNNIKSLYITLIFLLPLVSSLFYSDSIRNERSNGIYGYYVTRLSIKSYFLSKIITIFILNTLTIFFSVASIELIIWLSVPNLGCQYINTTPIYQYIIQEPHIFAYSLYNYNPYLYDLFIILILSLYSGIIGVISMAISLLFTKLKNPHSIISFIITVIGLISFTAMLVVFSIWKEGRR